MGWGVKGYEHLPPDGLGLHALYVDQRTRGRRGERPTGSDPDDAILWFDDISSASERERYVRVAHNHDRLEPPQVLVHPPRLGHLHTRAHRLRMLTQLHLKTLKQCHRVSGRAREAAHHARLERSHLGRLNK